MKKALASLAVLGALLTAGCVQQPAAVQPVVVAPTRPVVACDTRFRVVNNSGLTVAQLFFSHSALSAWGNDQLGTAVLPPGRFVNYQARNAGNYDFRVVWTNGRSAELRQVNICAASQIIVTNNGLRAI